MGIVHEAFDRELVVALETRGERLHGMDDGRIIDCMAPGLPADRP